MSSITTDMTLRFTKELTVLYVEDDLKLQEQVKKFFELLFQSVTVVNNGAEAFEKYKKEPYDIVVSDIKMPTMDGLELTKKIKQINHSQAIIITSVHDSIENLLQFINLNIKYFLQKPFKLENMLETLYSISKEIVNEKMVEEYRLSLEKSNQELTIKNEELQSLVRILDSKLLQIAKGDNTATCDIDEQRATIPQNSLDELEELEVDISGAIVILGISKNITLENMKILANLLLAYAKILEEFPIYEELCEHIRYLGDTLNSAPQNLLYRLSEISVLLESFIYVLHLWRENIAKKEFSKSFEFHSSMINDILSIINIIEEIKE